MPDCQSKTNLARPTDQATPWRDGLRAEVIDALCLDSLMMLCSAEHILDHLERRSDRLDRPGWASATAENAH